MNRDERAAQKVKKFLETYCLQSKAPWHGKPLKLLPWQWNEIVLPLYGTLKADGKTRQYKRAGIWCPKKQGKSCLLSGLALYHVLEQPGSEVYVIASTVQQSGVIFNEAANMAEAHPALAKRLRVRRNIKAIEDQRGKSVIRVLSSEPEGKSGFSANAIFYDELAEWGAHARDVWDKLFNACAARHNSLQVVISTAQYNFEHIGREQFNYAKRCKEDPALDPTFLPVLYSLDEHADWKDPENWWKVNPSAGVTVPQDDYFDDFKTVENNPLSESRFRTFRLCQWVGSSQQWIASNVWAACGEDYTEDRFHGAAAYLAIDYARKHDLCSYAVLVEEGGVVYVLPRFFIPREIAFKKEQMDNVPYRAWASNPRNNLHLTDGDVIDPKFLIRSIVEDCRRFRPVEVAFDPYGLELIRQELEFTHGLPMVEVPQTPRYMSPATAHFERLCLAKKLRHPRNPVLDWCLGNCAVRVVNEDQIMLEKRKNTQRIDGIVACCIGLSRILAQQPDKGEWVLTL